MSYTQHNGTVTLKMTEGDYDFLLICMGIVLGFARNKGRERFPVENVYLFLNRLNEGNPNYTPYEVPSE